MLLMNAFENDALPSSLHCCCCLLNFPKTIYAHEKKHAKIVR